MNPCKIAAFLALMSHCACTYGETRYFIGGTTSKEALLDASFWKDAAGISGTSGEALSRDIDYVVNTGSLYTPNTDATGAGIFSVRSLTLGEVGGNSGSMYVYTTGKAAMSFGEGGLVLNKGTIFAQWYPITFDGTVSIGAPSNAVFNIQNYYANTKFLFAGELAGVEGTGVRFFPHGNAMAENSLTAELFDCSGFHGTIFAGNANGAYITTTAILLGSDMPGAVHLYKTGSLKPLFGTNSVTVGAMTLDSGSTLSFGSRIWTDDNGIYHGTTGCFRVTGAFSAAKPIRIRLDENAVVPNGKTCRIPLLTVPSGQDISAADFALAPPSGDCVQVGELKIDEDESTGAKTLVAVFEPVVMMTKSDAERFNLNYAGANAITNGAFWSDGLPPHEGAHYLVRAIPGVTTNDYKFSVLLHSLSGTTDSDRWMVIYNQVFPGKSLTLGKACGFLLASRKFTCEKIRILDGGGICTSLAITDTSPAIEGKIEVPSGASAYFGSTGKWTVEASVSGGGTIIMPGPLSATSSRTGGIQFNDLSGFTGRILVREFSSSETGNGNGHWPSYSANYQTLYVGTPSGIGGDCAELDFFGTTLQRYSRLRTVSSVAIPASCRRGLYVKDAQGGIVYVDKTGDAPHVLDIGVPLTLNGSMLKEGPGCLKLRGELRFNADASEQPTAGKNIIEVCEGTIAAASAGCLDGAALSFASGAGLAICVSTNDSEFLSFGLRNTKWDSPFTLAEGMEKLPLSFDVSEFPDEEFRKIKSLRIGLLTVKSSAAAAVRAMLPLNLKPYHCCRGKVVEIPRADTGSVTFALDTSLVGMTIVLR